MSLLLQGVFALMVALIAVHVAGVVIRSIHNLGRYWFINTAAKQKFAYFAVALCTFSFSFTEAGRIATLIH